MQIGRRTQLQRDDIWRESWRGYELGTRSGDPMQGNEISLQACGPQGVFGTLSLRLDSGGGLRADELYRPEIDAYRNRARVVCEMTGFAVDRDYGSREMLACLFHLLYLYAHRRHGCSEPVHRVNPRHVGFYEQRLRFRLLGDAFEGHVPAAMANATSLNVMSPRPISGRAAGPAL